MKVIATETGFYDGSLRQRGATFEVPDGTKLRWTVPAEGGDVEKSAQKAVAKAGGKGASKAPDAADPKALSELAPGGAKFNDVMAGGDLA